MKNFYPHQRAYIKYFGAIPLDSNGNLYDVHHKDGNHFNNNSDNLEALPRAEHTRLHMKGKKFPNRKPMSIIAKKKASIKLKGRIPWNKGIKLSDEHKQNIANGQVGRTSGMKGKKHSKETIDKMKGRIPPNKGIPMSDERKKAQSIERKGIPWTDKYRKKHEETRQRNKILNIKNE